MKTETIQIYKFEELDEPIKEKVIEKNRDINTDYDWYDGDLEFISENLKEHGIEADLKSVEFDIYRGEFSFKVTDINIKKFLEQNDKKLLATLLLNKKLNVGEIYLNNENSLSVDTDEEYDEAILEGIQEQITDFLKDKRREYLKMVRESYDYLCSDEAIKETIEANEYDFLKDGSRW